MLWMLIDWLMNGAVAIRRWTKVIIVGMAVHFGFYLSLGFQYYGVENWKPLTMVFLLVWMVALALVVRRYISVLDLGTDTELSLDRSGLPVIGALALMLFVFAMPTIGAWYFLWPLPFVLVIGPRDVRETMLWLLLWHVVGSNVSLLPGLPPVN
jgi:hypothetical protein